MQSMLRHNRRRAAAPKRLVSVLLVVLGLLGVLLLGVAVGALGMWWPEGRRAPYPVALAGFVLASNLAGLMAWRRAMGRQRRAPWEPTRRPG